MKIRFSYGLLLVMCLLSGFASPVAADTPVVRAVMFYSPSCGHCHYVITEVLTPLMEEYGEQLEIIGINTADPGGQALYQATVTEFSIPQERMGVPTLVIGDIVLVGSVEIPEQLPGLIEDYLAESGMDWPAIPGLVEALEANAATPESETSPTPESATPQPTTPATEATMAPAGTADPVAIPGVITNEDWVDRYARDPLGNSISVLVLVGMLVSVVCQVMALTREPTTVSQQRWRWAIPPLVVLGLIVAGYLAYVETQQVTAICGPVGDCNAVQQSEFALLFGFLPIAVLGLIGYVGIGTAWAVARFGSGLWVHLAKLALVGMAWFGMAFSIYLTFLEPFVIGATCAWCLTSAVVMTLLFWVIAPLARPALAAVRASRN